LQPSFPQENGTVTVVGGFVWQQQGTSTTSSTIGQSGLNAQTYSGQARIIPADIAVEEYGQSRQIGGGVIILVMIVVGGGGSLVAHGMWIVSVVVWQ